MSLIRSLAGAALLVATTAAGALAQASTSFGPFLSYSDAHHLGSPATAGAQMTLFFSGALGVRGSGAILMDNSGRLDASAPNGWDADADVVMRLAHAGGSSFSLVPYIFGGLGGRSRPDVLTGQTDFFHTRSIGAGAALTLSRALQFTAEARQRAQRATGEDTWHSGGPTEVRLGMFFRL